MKNKMKKKIIIVGIIAITAILFVSSINKGTNEEIKIGVIAGMTGDWGIVGEHFLNGVTLAQEEWNQDNPDKTIEIIFENDDFDAKKGLSAYQKLVSVNMIDGLINMTTFTVDVIAEDAIERNLPVAQGFVQTNTKDDSIFQLWPNSNYAQEKLGEYIKEKGYTNTVLLVDKSSSAWQVFAQDFKEGYQLPLKEISVGTDAVELRSAALKTIESKPDAVILFVQPSQGATLVKEINKLSKNSTQFVFDASLQTGFQTYTDLLGDSDVLNGSILYIIPTNYEKDFVKTYTERFGKEPSIGSETGYNSFTLISRTYNSSVNKWIKNMKTESFIGADGLIKLDEKGTRIPEIKMGIIENGQLPQ